MTPYPNRDRQLFASALWQLGLIQQVSSHLSHRFIHCYPAWGPLTPALPTYCSISLQCSSDQRGERSLGYALVGSFCSVLPELSDVHVQNGLRGMQGSPVP